MVVMRVPTLVGLAELIPTDRHEFHSCFEQPPSGQTGLTKQSHAIVRTQRHRLAFQSQSINHLRACEELQSQFTLLGVSAGARRCIEFRRSLFKLSQQRAAACEHIECHSRTGFRTEFESSFRRDLAKRIDLWGFATELSPQRIKRGPKETTECSRPFVRPRVQTLSPRQHHVDRHATRPRGGPVRWRAGRRCGTRRGRTTAGRWG